MAVAAAEPLPPSPLFSSLAWPSLRLLVVVVVALLLLLRGGSHVLLGKLTLDAVDVDSARPLTTAAVKAPTCSMRDVATSREQAIANDIVGDRRRNLDR